MFSLECFSEQSSRVSAVHTDRQEKSNMRSYLVYKGPREDGYFTNLLLETFSSISLHFGTSPTV